MNTQIVYALVSSEKDIYYEQTLLSVFTLRHFNPDAKTTLVVDSETANNLNGPRSEIREYIDNVIVVKTPSELNPLQQSRYLKTTLRNTIEGDFFYIDGDTIICGSLEGLDRIQADIAAVPDAHGIASLSPWYKSQSERVKKLFGVEIVPNSFYYNSGGIYVKDSKEARTFFEQWNKNWNISVEKGCSLDQPAFYYTDQQSGNLICRLDDIYNCQISCSFTYFHPSVVIHYWGSSANESNTYEWARKSFYMKIKKEGHLTEGVKNIALNCKTTIPTPSILLANKDYYEFFNSEFGVRILKEYQKKSFFLKTIQYILCFYQKTTTLWKIYVKPQ